MSNLLSRGKKKTRVVGLSKQEMEQLKESRGKSSTDVMIADAFQNLRLISYQVLHDKFGFGQKRIIRVEQSINRYLDAAADGELSDGDMEYFLKEKCGIDAREEANQVPFRERFALTEIKAASALMPAAGKLLLAAIYHYFLFLGACLKTQFKFSARRIKEAFEWVRYYVNSLAAGYETMTGVASVLACECGYCDERFMERTYEI